MSEPSENCEPDYNKYNEDSVPVEEREIEKSHPGRPDLDYDQTPVGPSAEVVEQQERENDS